MVTNAMMCNSTVYRYAVCGMQIKKDTSQWNKKKHNHIQPPRPKKDSCLIINKTRRVIVTWRYFIFVYPFFTSQQNWPKKELPRHPEIQTHCTARFQGHKWTGIVPPGRRLFLVASRWRHKPTKWAPSTVDINGVTTPMNGLINGYVGLQRLEVESYPYYHFVSYVLSS